MIQLLIPLLMAAAGAGIGAATNKKNRLKGALIGGGAGALGGAGLGALGVGGAGAAAGAARAGAGAAGMMSKLGTASKLLPMLAPLLSGGQAQDISQDPYLMLNPLQPIPPAGSLLRTPMRLPYRRWDVEGYRAL